MSQDDLLDEVKELNENLGDLGRQISDYSKRIDEMAEDAEDSLDVAERSVSELTELESGKKYSKSSLWWGFVIFGAIVAGGLTAMYFSEELKEWSRSQEPILYGGGGTVALESIRYQLSDKYDTVKASLKELSNKYL